VGGCIYIIYIIGGFMGVLTEILIAHILKTGKKHVPSVSYPVFLFAEIHFVGRKICKDL